MPRPRRPPHSRRRHPLRPHRTQHPLLLSLRLPRPHAHRSPPGPLFQARRQEHRLCPHPLLVFAYYLLSIIGSRLRQIRQALALPRSLGHQLHLHRLRPYSSSSSSPAEASCSTSSPPSAQASGKKLSAIAPAASSQLSPGSPAPPKAAADGQPTPHHQQPATSADAHRTAHPAQPSSSACAASFKTSFPLLLDEYVMRAYATNFFLSLGSFALLFLIFTFFELIGDIIRNRTPFVIVGDYLFNLIPYIVSAVTPLCSLLAVLITFGALNRNSELTAMKATGISLYRVLAPILVLAAILAAALFAFDESYLPGANRRQEAAPRRNQRQARPDLPPPRPQVDLRPDRNKRRRPPPASSTTRPSTATATSSPTSPSSSSIPRPSPSSAASSPKRPLGPHRQQLGLRQRLAAHLRRRNHRRLSNPSPSPPSPRSRNSPATSSRKTSPPTRCPTAS